MRRAILLQLIEPLALKTFPVLPRWFAAATAQARRPPLRRAIWIAEPRPGGRYGGSWWRSAGCAKRYCACPRDHCARDSWVRTGPPPARPSAAARCMGPVSPPIKSAARRVSSTSCETVQEIDFRGAAAGVRNLLRQRLLAGAEIYQRANASFGKPSSYFRERRRRPALCSPACTRVQDAETRGPLRSATARTTSPSRRRGEARAHRSSSGMPATAEMRARFCCATWLPETDTLCR